MFDTCFCIHIFWLCVEYLNSDIFFVVTRTWDLGVLGGNTSTAPKPTSDDPAGVSDADARSAEEMADSVLLDSPLPDAEEEEEQRQ